MAVGNEHCQLPAVNYKRNTMLKYIKNYAASIKDVDVYPLISLSIFVLFFIAVLYYVKKMDKAKVTEMQNLPLDPDDETNPFAHTAKQA